MLIFMYDEAGSPVGFQYRNSSYASDQFDTYWYRKNLQGDVMAIYDADGTTIAWYAYDAFGKQTYGAWRTHASNLYKNIYNLNPYRYRSYYYDTETSLYYLNSRYYDPATCRFINADEYTNGNGDIIGYNMYAYCSNNPVNLTDPSGNGWLADWWEKIADEFSDWWNEQVEEMALFGTLLYESIVVDIGYGSGCGGSVEIGDFDVKGLYREDSFSIVKQAGGDFQTGRVIEKTFAISAVGCVFPVGSYEFHGNDEEDSIYEKLYPHGELVFGLGAQGYCGFGVTFYIGIDIGYIINQWSIRRK